MMVAVASFTFACSASAVLAQVAAATGGASWKGASEVVASGRLTSSGLQGTALTYDDPRDGRYALRFRLPVKGTSVQVYDGHTVWARDISGGVHAYDSWYPRARAVTEAYLTRRAYLDPRESAGATCAGLAKNGSDPMALVRLAPRGGIPATLSIDTRTHLIDSVAIRTPITTDLTTFADYRQVGALVLPFSIAFSSAYEPANADRIEVTRYAIAPRVNAADFARPAARESARMLGGTGSTTVPIVLEGRQLLVWASIDGRPAMPFILDTGGHAILDTVAAKALGLRAAGAGVSGGAGAGTIALQYARVKSVRIGDAELLDQPFLIIPYPYDFYERGRKAPLAGILGLEWFERYAARIDYALRTLTLTPLRTFSYGGHGTPVPMRFQEDMPLARASAEGHDGSFGVDTGNAGVVVLYGDFLSRSGLLAKHARGYTLLGRGTGGANSGRIETLSSFALGGHTLPNLAAYFTQMKSGSFSSWTEAGDLGLTVLSRFTPTFDYANQTLYLDPAARPLVLPPNRSGLTFEKNRPGAIDVLAVRPNSAASELGIVAGDQIVAVNGKNARELSSADFLDAVTAPQGTPVQLTIAHGASTRTVQLILR
jgi:PDZ domain/Aspartyl protease